MWQHRSAILIAGLVTSLIPTAASAQAVRQPGQARGQSDSAFAAMQARGNKAMGVDQYTSTHQFDALPDGGRIELQRDSDDSAGVAQIRRHLQEITQSFKAGDFTTPAFVHMQPVPGAAVMAAKRNAITYTYRELPRGGEVRIVTQDPQAVQAIHEFMAFQRQDHRAGGMDHGAMHHDSTHRQSMAPDPDHDGAFASDMRVVHELLLNHDAIRRTVTTLPDGIRTVTESDDPQIAKYISDHVASMDQRLKDGNVFNMASHTIPTIFESKDRIHAEIRQTARGVILTQTSDDPATVAALQAHASEVSDLVQEGTVALMRSVMANGGPMGNGGVARHGQMGRGMGMMQGMMGGMMNDGGPMMGQMMHQMMQGRDPAGSMHGSDSTTP